MPDHNTAVQPAMQEAESQQSCTWSLLQLTCYKNVNRSGSGIRSWTQASSSIHFSPSRLVLKLCQCGLLSSY